MPLKGDIKQVVIVLSDRKEKYKTSREKKIRQLTWSCPALF